MKTLKFMLAAATAIGLASASQADQRVVPVDFNDGTITFDSETTGTAATNLTGFAFNGDPADDASEVVAPGRGDTGKALQVSVGTEPLLRALDWRSSAAQNVSLGDGPLEINTYVQFTVTPVSESVEASVSDKLMIYLQETTNAVGVASTNLMVKAARYTAGGDILAPDPTFTPKDVAITNVTVNPGTWYNLKVKAQKDAANVVYFSLYLDDSELACGTNLYPEDVDGFKFPSLLGASSGTLQYVGFAGEGLVDDITVTQYQTETSVNFTLTLEANVSSVAYSINGVDQTPVSATTTVPVYEDDLIRVGTVTYAEGYRAASGSPAAADFAGTDDGVYRVGTDACSLTFTAALNSVNFTFSLGTGVTAINWTIAGGSASTATSGSGTPGAEITINSVTYADWYVAAGSVTNGAVLTASATTFNVEAAAAGGVTPPAEPGAPVAIDETTTPAAIGITTGAFAEEGAGSATLAKVVAWATASGKGGYGSMSAAVAAINAMDFTDANETAAEKAYLLNCAESEVAAKAAAFKFSEIDTSSLPPAVSGTTGVNGTVVIQGATTLGDWHTATENDKFFRAVLTK